MLKDIAKIFSSHIIVKILGLISIVIVLKFLSIEEFGEYSYYLVLLNLSAITIDPRALPPLLRVNHASESGQPTAVRAYGYTGIRAYGHTGIRLFWQSV